LIFEGAIMFTKHHRTAILFYAMSDDQLYQERAVRFIESLTPQDIKYDPFIVMKQFGSDEAAVYPGLPTTNMHVEPVCMLTEFYSFAVDQGYDQIIHSHGKFVDIGVDPAKITYEFFNVGDHDEKLAALKEMHAAYTKSQMEPHLTAELIEAFLNNEPSTKENEDNE